MVEVETIKCSEEVLAIAELLEKHSGEIYSDVWLLACNTALRATDVLTISYKQITNDVLTVRAGKTGKTIKIQLNNRCKAIIAKRRASNRDALFLFQSKSNRTGSQIKPLSRQAMAKALKDVCTTEQFSGRVIGMHSARKSYGYRLYKATNDIGLVQKTLQHSSTAHTLRYIGIDQEDINNAFELAEV